MLEADYKAPCMDYHILMKLTRILTIENKEDLENMFRRMCFNVFAHNRDDHAKNFSFLYDDGLKGWRLSPAYDLTYSSTYFGEHTTSVDGNGAIAADAATGAGATKVALPEGFVAGGVHVDDAGNLMISFDFYGNPTLGGAAAPSAPAEDATDAPAAGDVAASTDSTKGSPDTGVEDVAVVAGLAIVAAGAVLVSKKRK